MNHRGIVAGLALACLAAPLATAQGTNPDARVSLRVEGRSLSDVVDYLQRESGANIVIKQGGDQAISIEITDIAWREALELVTELAGCVVEERAAGVLVIDKPTRVKFNFPSADVREVIDTIAAIAGANIVIAPEVVGTISMRLNDVPWRDALEVAAKTLGFVVVEENRGVLRVVDPLSLQSQMVTRSYQLRYMRPKGDFVPVIHSEFVAGAPKPPTGDILKDFPVIGALRKALSEGGELDYIDTQNVMIVRDTEQVHDAISAILSRLDVEPAQVFVDVKFVTTTNADIYNLGVDYGDTGPTISLSGSQIPITFPFNEGSGGFEDGLALGDNQPNTPGSLLNPAGTTTPDTIFGALSFTGFAATLRMLQRDTESEVVQAPKIIALDGAEATIFVGETIRYAEARSEQGQAGGLQLSVSEASGSPIDVGFQLMIVPHVIPGTNRLTLDVIPKETSLSGTGDSDLAPPGFDVFTVGSGGSTGSIALPRKRSSTIVTSMLLESGQTAVVGGLSTDTDIHTESRVPYLSAIPLLGELFKYKENTRERRSMMVFITPSIVRSAADSERLLQRELDRRRALYDSELEALFVADLGLEDSEDLPALGDESHEPSGN